VRAIAGQETVAPLAADFHDGYINAVLCDALLQAAKTGRVVHLKPMTR
jgi:predicted dehydrogenase